VTTDLTHTKLPVKLIYCVDTTEDPSPTDVPSMSNQSDEPGSEANEACILMVPT
jgi:hypothetical protein